MSQLHADLAQKGVNQVSVKVYDAGSRNPNFTMMRSAMTIITLTQIPGKKKGTLPLVNDTLKIPESQICAKFRLSRHFL